MRTSALSFVVVHLVVLSSCREAPVTTACERLCVEGERCDVPTRRCLPNEGPVIVVTTPIAESLINTAELA